MRHLFTLNDSGEVEILPQAWLYEPFRAIRDKYNESGIAAVEMGLVYFAADYRSDFVDVPVMKDRVQKIKTQVYLNRKLKIDKLTFAAIKFYEENQDTVKIKLVRAVNTAVIKAIAAINLLDFADLKSIESLATITTKLPPMLENLDALEKFVKKEQDMEDGVVGSGSKSVYEDD